MRIFRKFYGVKGYWSFYDWSVRMRDMVTNKAEWRAKVVTFFNKYGLQAAEEAFGVKKSSIYKWKKLLQNNEGRLESLNDGSKVPKNRRQSNWNPDLVNFIQDLRQQYPRLGKEKIKLFLDEFCLKNKIPTVSESTIGRIITKKNLFFHPKKITHFGKIVKTQYHKKLRRKGYQPQAPGDLLQIDSITRFKDGVKRYILTAIDFQGEFAFAYGYSSLSSKSAKDFFEKLESVAPFEIKSVQTDNGLEFEKYFRGYLAKKGITHF